MWIPGYNKPHRDPFETFEAETKEDVQRIVNDISALSLISPDDPPIFMSYGMNPDDPIPEDPGKARGWKIHHVTFGVKLKEVMDQLGIEADLHYPGVESTLYPSREDFLSISLRKTNRNSYWNSQKPIGRS